MELMKQKIREEGKVLPGGILKVGSFLNQQIDTDFFACGRCAAERKICGNPRDLWATTKRTMR